MCDLDGRLEQCEVWREVERQARKDHRCDCCGGTIHKGETYTVHFSLLNHVPTSQKMCAGCKADREEFAEAHEVTPTPGMTTELLVECIAEREDFSQMLKWSRMLRRIKKRARATT